jgi:hypothetical protein
MRMASTYQSILGKLVEGDAGRGVGVIGSKSGASEEETEAPSLSHDLLCEG